MTDTHPDPRSIAPPVPLHEVEWRIDGKPRDGRARYVPYIDARWCAKALDEWVGPGNWTVTPVPTVVMGADAVFCTVAIRFEHGWVEKTDVGSDPGMVKVKGTVSDAFKRTACVQWGVGRNVYSLPGDIWAEVRMVGDKAFPSKGAIQQIWATLRERGHEITKVEPDDPEGKVSGDTDTTRDDELSITHDEAAALIGMFNAILDDDARSAAKSEFARAWGDPRLIPQSKHTDAVAQANGIIFRHPPADETAPPAAPPAAEHPTPAPDDAARSEAESPRPPAAGAPADGEDTTELLDKIPSMGLRDITPLLNRFGLAATGKLEEKKSRLIEHLSGSATPAVTMVEWQAGAEVARHPQTGAVLPSSDELRGYILGYEDEMVDQSPFYTWWNDQFGAKKDTELTHYELHTAYLEAARVLKTQTEGA